MNDKTRYTLSGSVIDSSLTWIDSDRAALVWVETTTCLYRVMLQKLLRTEPGGAWFVVGIDSHAKEFGPVFPSFRTRDIDEARSIIPFNIILPRFLPGNVKSAAWISGPVREDQEANTDDCRAQIIYISAEPGAHFTAMMSLIESNRPVTLPDSASKEEYKRMVIDGVDLVEWTLPMRDPKTKADLDISFCQFMWNQAGIGFTVDIHGFKQDEALRVVASMIQRMEPTPHSRNE